MIESDWNMIVVFGGIIVALLILVFLFVYKPKERKQ